MHLPCRFIPFAGLFQRFNCGNYRFNLYDITLLFVFI